MMINTQIKNAKVSDIMNTNLYTVRENEILEKVESIFSSQKIHHLPVENEAQELVGMISKSDMQLVKHWGTKLGLTKAQRSNSFIMRTQLAKDIMTKKLVTVSTSTSLEKCAELFKTNQFHSLPVIEKGKLVGIITTYDLLAEAYK